MPTYAFRDFNPSAASPERPFMSAIHPLRTLAAHETFFGVTANMRFVALAASLLLATPLAAHPTGAATPLVVGVAMALTRSRIVQNGGLILLIGWLFAGYWSYTIS